VLGRPTRGSGPGVPGGPLWKRAARISAVRWRGRTLVPGFQLLPSGLPDPALQPVLRVLQGYGMGDWEQAVWWTVPASALGGRRPVDVLLACRSAGAEGSPADERALVEAAHRRRDWF
jgi:hypothetical protein